MISGVRPNGSGSSAGSPGGGLPSGSSLAARCPKDRYARTSATAAATALRSLAEVAASGRTPALAAGAAGFDGRGLGEVGARAEKTSG